MSAAGEGWSQTYPTRTIQVVVAYAAGGTGDIVARSVADKLGATLGQSVVVENRAGASGAIGAHSVATAAPDGYTLLVGQTGEMAVNQHWLKGLNYDPDKDLVPIALAAVVPLALVVPAKAPYSTMPEFLSALKAKPKMTSRPPVSARRVISRANCSSFSSTKILPMCPTRAPDQR